MFEYEQHYMKRALELAARGRGYTSPNPMVGAVIVNGGKIIGEGYHRCCGEGHAEVNAIASVTKRELLADSTMYVTLEPCSHYGKTPPCAKLIIESMIPRVVVGAVDPFSKVAGRGIAMLREAGIDVIEGVMALECQRLNEVFFTAHTLHRPYVTLKWAQSADMYMDQRRDDCTGAARFSNLATGMLTHRLRAMHDVILTTAATVNADDPLLTVRLWWGRDPKPVVIDRRDTITPGSAILSRGPIIINSDMSLDELLSNLYSRGYTSVLVEAGPRLLQSFIDAGLWDQIRVETTSWQLEDKGSVKSPNLSLTPVETEFVEGNRIDIYYRKNALWN